MKSTDEFYQKQPEPNKSCFIALRNLITAHNDHLSETVKYGMPCFTYNNKAFCYLWTDKLTHEPYILMVDGKLLKHSSLEQGDRARMKILRINPNEDLPLNIINEVLQEGLALRS